MMADKSEGLRQRLAAMNTTVDHYPRCRGMTDQKDEVGVQLECGKLLAEIATCPWRIKCGRCGHVNEG